MRQEIEGKTNDGTILRSLHVKAIETLRTVSPQLQVLEQYEIVVEPFHLRMEVNDEESRTLASIRDALLPKLLSGNIRIKDAEKYAN